MTDIELNKLGVKSDSLPNDWYVTLVNPKEGEPGGNMTIARFTELFTPKQPEATKDSKGLMSTKDYSLVQKLKHTLGIGYIKIIPGTDHYHQIQLLFMGGMAPSAATYSIYAISVKNNAVPAITRLTVGNNIEAYYRIVEGISELYIKSDSIGGNIVILQDSANYTIEIVDSLPAGTTVVTVFTISVSASTKNALYAFEPNILTETIVEEVPVSADTPMTLEETEQPALTTQTVKHYEYSISKMAEAILELQKQVADLKA